VRTTPGGRCSYKKGITEGVHDIVVMRQESATNASNFGKGTMRAKCNNWNAWREKAAHRFDL